MPKAPFDGVDDDIKQSQVWNNRNKNIPVAIELDNSNEDYPVSRVIKQDAEGNVIVEKVIEEEEESLRIVYDCDGNKHVLGRDQQIESNKKITDEKDLEQTDCQYCDNEHCNHDASGNYRHNYHSELEYDEEYDKELVQKEPDAIEDVNELKTRTSKIKETKDINDYQDTDFESENEHNQRCTCSLPHYHDYVDNATKPNIASRKKKSTISPSTLLEKQKNIIYQQIQKPVIGNFLWDFEFPEDIPDMTEFWLQLPYERKREIASMDFAEVLKLVSVDLKSTCTCALCGHKKALVERELEKLYNGYYNVRRLAVRYLDSVDLNINSINSILGIIEEERTEDEVIEPTDSKLSVTGLLSVADDLVKNNGENFINLIEKLDNNDSNHTEVNSEDIVQVLNKEVGTSKLDVQSKKDGVSDSDIEHGQDELWDQSEDAVAEDELDGDSDEGDLSDASNNSNISNNDYTSEKRLEETYKMLQICASKILRKRLHDAFQAKRAEDISRSLLDEAENEIRLKKEKEEKEKARKEKAKEKKRLLKLAKEEEQRKLEEERREKERLLKEEQLRKTEEGRRKKEAERKKREEELRIKQEEKRRKKELEMERQKKEKEEKERKKAEMRKLREAELKAKKEEKERKEMERKLRQQEKQRQTAQQGKNIIDTKIKEQITIETTDTQKAQNIKHILKRDSDDFSLRDTNSNLESVSSKYESNQNLALDENFPRENSISEANSNMFSNNFTGLDLPVTDAQLPRAGFFDSLLLSDSTKTTSDIQKRNHSIWNAGVPSTENLYIEPIIENRHNSIWSPVADANLSLNQSNWNNATNDNAMTNLPLGVPPQFHQIPVQTIPKADDELIQQEVLKATWHLPSVSKNRFSIALLYHYTKGVLNNLLPDFTMQKFVNSLSVNLESKINARFHIFRDNNNEDNVEILFRTSSSTDMRFESTSFPNMPNGNFTTYNNATMIPDGSSPYNNLNVDMNTNFMNLNSNIYPSLNSNIDPSLNMNSNFNGNLNPNLNSSLNNNLNNTMNSNMLNMLNSNLNTNLNSNLNLNSNAHLFNNSVNMLDNYGVFNNANSLETSPFNDIKNMNPYDMNRPNHIDSSYNNMGFINNTHLGDMNSFKLNVTDNNPSINTDSNVGYNPMYLGGISASMNNLNLNTEIARSSLLDNLNINQMKGPDFVSGQTELQQLHSSPGRNS